MMLITKGKNSCREAALKIKKSSGIKRFQEEKQFGSWFNKLFAVVKSMDSCQPEQLLEPDCADDDLTSDKTRPDHNDEAGSSSSPETVLNKKRKLFVPIHETNKKAKKRNSENIEESLKSINEALCNDPTRELLEFLKEDSQRQEQRDDRFMNLMERMLTMPMQQQTVPVQPTYPWNAMGSPAPQTTPHHRYGMSNRQLGLDGPVYENLSPSYKH